MNRKIDILPAYFKFVSTTTPHFSFNTPYFIFITLQLNQFVYATITINHMSFGNGFCNKYIFSMKIKSSKNNTMNFGS